MDECLREVKLKVVSFFYINISFPLHYVSCSLRFGWKINSDYALPRKFLKKIIFSNGGSPLILGKSISIEDTISVSSKTFTLYLSFPNRTGTSTTWRTRYCQCINCNSAKNIGSFLSAAKKSFPWSSMKNSNSLF